MFFFLFLLVFAGFILYFWSVDLSFFSLLFLVAFLPFLGSLSFRLPAKQVSQHLAQYALYLAWAIVLIAAFGLCSFFHVGFSQTCISLLVANLFLRGISYLFFYEDGKRIFLFGYLLVAFAFLIITLFTFGFPVFFDLFFLLLILFMAFQGFLLFIVSLWVSLGDHLAWQFPLTVILFVLCLVLRSVPSFLGALALDSLLLFGMYLALSWFIQQQPALEEKSISARRILAGEKVLKRRIFSHATLHHLYHFILTFPVGVRYFFEGLNIVLGITVIGYFFLHMGTIGLWNQLLYWIIIGCFVGNVLFLKKVAYTSVIQNFFFFLILHFGVYISLFSWFTDPGFLVFWAVVWHVIASLFLIFGFSFFRHIFTVVDYRYRLSSLGIIFVVNIVLLFMAPFAPQLLFFLMILYLGFGALLGFYCMKHVLKMSEEVE